jgi:hypothetical protein
MALAAYDTWCKKEGRPIFPVTPIHLHQCNPNCRFFIHDTLTAVCKTSRHIHRCTKNCGTIITESRILCGLTSRCLDERSVNCYYDGTQSFTPNTTRKRTFRNETPAFRKTFIKQILIDLFHGERREKLETKNNQRLAKLRNHKLVKDARQLRLFRSHWHRFYFLAMNANRHQNRIIPNIECLNMLALKIYEFWSTLFPTDTFQAKKMTIFVATCVAELATGESPYFPLIPWLRHAVGSYSVIQLYSGSLDITCRSMTGTLMAINDAAKAKSYTFSL